MMEDRTVGRPVTDAEIDRLEALLDASPLAETAMRTDDESSAPSGSTWKFVATSRLAVPPSPATTKPEPRKPKRGLSVGL
jgi:hypothetical protein